MGASDNGRFRTTPEDTTRRLNFYREGGVGALIHLPDNGRRGDSCVEKCPRDRVPEHRQRYREVGDVAV